MCEFKRFCRDCSGGGVKLYIESESIFITLPLPPPVNGGETRLLDSLFIPAISVRLAVFRQG